jgi:4-hydroxy-tetrahydrodipicolinate synthase
MSAMLPLMRVLEQGGKFIQCVKHGMTAHNLSVGPPRKPLQPLDKDEKCALEQVISIMNKTIDQILEAK